ncbi:MAG: hypothetical protein ACE5G8_05820, partial [Anaerolineae bacterium]
MMKRWTLEPITRTPAARYTVAGALVGVTLVLLTLLPVTYKDWADTFRPAALHWPTPYFQPGLIFNPPWLFPALYPIALLPERLGAGLLMLLSLAVLGVYLGSPKKFLVVVFSAPMITLFTLGQIDVLMLLGLMIPGGLGLPILLVKPQGVFLAALRRINRRSVAVTAAVVVLSVAGWGFWWQKIIGYDPNAVHNNNVSIFPYGVLAGIVLLYYGLKRNSDAMLCFASLCLTPYFMITSMLPALAALVRETDDRRWWAA